MIIHNYFTIETEDKKTYKTNTISSDFNSLFNTGENLLEYFYIYYGESELLKVKAEYECGNIYKNCFLKLKAELDETQIQTQLIRSVGLGSESGYINMADANDFVKTGKALITAVIFIDLSTPLKIISDDFLKLLFNVPYEIRCMSLSDYEFESGITNALTYPVIKTITNGKINLSVETEQIKDNMLFLLNGKPAFAKREILAENYGESYSQTSANFCIDTGNNIRLESSESPLHVTESYGNYVLKGEKVGVLDDISECDELKSSSKGSFFCMKKANFLYLYSCKKDKVEPIAYFNGCISVEDSSCYNICESGVALLNGDGNLVLYNLLDGQMNVLSEVFTDINKIEIADDFSFANLTGNSHGYLYYINSETLYDYYPESEEYCFNPASGSLFNFYSENITVHYMDGEDRNFLIFGSNLLNINANQNILCFDCFIAKIIDYTAVVFNICNSGILSFSDNTAKEFKFSPSGKYMFVKFDNEAIKLFRFNKKNFLFEKMNYGEPLPKGEYFFLGDDKLIKFSKDCKIYRIFEDKSQLIFKNYANKNKAFSVKQKINQIDKKYLINITAEAG